jgi:hypothetical protein
VTWSPASSSPFSSQGARLRPSRNGPAHRKTKVRVSVQRKILDSRGNVVEVKPIDDLTFYQDFFSRMAKSVYLQKERL